MLSSLFKLPETAERHREGPLGPHVDSFASYLRGRGYARARAWTMIRLIAAFSRWLKRHRLEVRDLEERLIEEFLRSRKRRYQIQTGDRAPLRMILNQLRAAGMVATPRRPTPESGIDRVERAYRDYLAKERQLAHFTQINYLPFVRLFLVERFGDGHPNLTALTAKDVIRFVRRHVHDNGPRRAKLMLTALRSFFRFLKLREAISADLVSCVPTVPNWRQTGLPQVLKPDEIKQILNSCDRSRDPGRRNYAILLLLARLGLRAGEVARLALKDIDWESGEIVVGGKRGRWNRLPLPGDVGHALADYLKRERPRCESRRVFVRSKAPRVGFTTSGAITGLVRRAIDRTGLRPPQRGAYLFRHTLATRMLGRGASLSEIGEILRHRDPDTTTIYAKVDLGRLRTLARPWPGGIV